MKTLTTTLVTATIIGMTGTASADPMEIETPDAKVIVIRPSEQWTANQGLLDDYDSGQKKQKYLLIVRDQNGKNTFANSSDISGWLKTAVSNMESAGWEASGWLPKNVSIIGPSASMTGTQFNGVIGVQERYYKSLIAKVGSPEMQKSAFNRGVAAGYVLTIGTLGLGAKMGIPTELLGLGTGVAEQIGAIPPALLTAVSPNWPASGDFSQYPVVDVRQVTPQGSRGVVGQIIIAYKGEKTPHAEEAAMAAAARALVGVDRPLEDVEKARTEDYNRRVTIWNECVASGKCKTE